MQSLSVSMYKIIVKVHNFWGPLSGSEPGAICPLSSLLASLILAAILQSYFPCTHCYDVILTLTIVGYHILSVPNLLLPNQGEHHHQKLAFQFLSDP